MSCHFSKERLALHVEDDLAGAAADTASRHLASCADCRRFLAQLQARQSLLKSLRRETVSPSLCTGMRRDVMSIINDGRDPAGWALRIERTIMLGFRRRSYALAAMAVLGIVSVSMLTQTLRSAPDALPALPVFEGRNTLLRPQGYRDWILAGPSRGWHRAGVEAGNTHPSDQATGTVYINPSGYREYAKTGRFPDGTLMIWESAPEASDPAARSRQQSPVLLASVKDSTRFAGGWGFFDFTGPEGRVTSSAAAVLDSSGCRGCHRRDAQTDHVFTQVYPLLRSFGHGA